jgi:hypothetical protein
MRAPVSSKRRISTANLPVIALAGLALFSFSGCDRSTGNNGGTAPDSPPPAKTWRFSDTSVDTSLFNGRLQAPYSEIEELNLKHLDHALLPDGLKPGTREKPSINEAGVEVVKQAVLEYPVLGGTVSEFGWHTVSNHQELAGLMVGKLGACSYVLDPVSGRPVSLGYHAFRLVDGKLWGQMGTLSEPVRLLDTHPSGLVPPLPVFCEEP